MARPQPPSVTVFPWLKANLGPRCLAPLTGTDWRALRASVEIVELYLEHRSAKVTHAFGLVVSTMQAHCRYLAFHAIAHVLDWGDRAKIWQLAGLDFQDLKGIPECSYAPKDGKKPYEP